MAAQGKPCAAFLCVIICERHELAFVYEKWHVPEARVEWVGVHEEANDPRHFLQAAYGHLQEVDSTCVDEMTIDLHAKRPIVILLTIQPVAASHFFSAFDDGRLTSIVSSEKGSKTETFTIMLLTPRRADELRLVNETFVVCSANYRGPHESAGRMLF